MYLYVSLNIFLPGLSGLEYGVAAGAAGVEEGEVEVGAGGAEGGIHRRVGQGVGAGRCGVVVLHDEGRRRVRPGGGAHDAHTSPGQPDQLIVVSCV